MHMEELHERICFGPQCLKMTSFLDFTTLDLFFQTEAPVRLCICKTLVLKCIEIKKNKRNRQKTRLPSILC
jgi:hypothetical protein